VTPVRRIFLWVLALLLTLVCVAAFADTEYAFDDVSARLTLADSYIVLTPENLGQHLEFIETLGKTSDGLEADFAERGVLLQAWVADRDACLEVTALQDEDALAWFDTEQQSNKVRNNYRASHLKDQKYKDQGYSIKSADWKKQTNGGRFLRIKYKRTVGETVYWGYAARTIRNGYTFTLDYQVFGRGLRAKDQTALNKVANSVSFTSVLPAPEQSAGLLSFTSVPPAESNTGSFTVEGTCTPEAHLIGVAMRWASSAAPSRFETTAKKSGSFKLPVTLPEEGIWLMTLTVEVGENIIAEEVFEATNYSKTLLPVALDAEIPEVLSGNELELTGKTSKAVTVQCIVTNGTTTYDKTIRTNGTGKFKFKVSTSLEADYDITLVFSKKNYETRRLNYTARRSLTETDIRNQQKAQAIKPAYRTLVSKLDAYTGRIMRYNVYLADVQQIGDEWIIYGALNKSRKDEWLNQIVIVSGENPGFEIGSQHMMYGTCTGSYQVQSEEGDTSYPSFDLLFWE